MPDPALERTERQFRNLLGAASGSIGIELSLYALPEISRTAWGKRHLAQHYSPIAAIGQHGLDALIVTGAEPKFAAFTDEPYWQSLSGIFDWATESLASVYLSCLAAHAAVFHTDGIQRKRLSNKRFGLFEHKVLGNHALSFGAIDGLTVAHSRWNELDEDQLARAGYDIVTRSEIAGVDLFVKEHATRQRTGLWIYFQGHPEYDLWNLAREYRRDVRQFLKGERPDYPGMPEAYFPDAEAAKLDDFQRKAMADRRPTHMSEFPIKQNLPEIDLSPNNPITQIIENWLRMLPLYGYATSA